MNKWVPPATQVRRTAGWIRVGYVVRIDKPRPQSERAGPLEGWGLVFEASMLANQITRVKLMLNLSDEVRLKRVGADMILGRSDNLVGLNINIHTLI